MLEIDQRGRPRLVTVPRWVQALANRQRRRWIETRKHPEPVDGADALAQIHAKADR